MMLRAALSQPTGPPREPPGGQDVDLDVVEQAGDARAAIVGDQRHPMAAQQQFLGERVGRHHMAAGPARGEDIVARHHLSPLHRTT